MFSFCCCCCCFTVKEDGDDRVADAALLNKDQSPAAAAVSSSSSSFHSSSSTLSDEDCNTLGFSSLRSGQSSKDADECPTCLEEYTVENPMIVTQCSHHYHLSCIYEWMERSSTCPACSKEMVFDESV